MKTIIEIDSDQIISDVNEKRALAYLLSTGIIDLNTINVDPDGIKADWSTVVYVDSSDVFMWGSSDCESIAFNDGDEPSEIIELFKRVVERPSHGYIQWLCLKRNMQPQPPIKGMMVGAGSWTDELEALPKNPADKSK